MAQLSGVRGSWQVLPVVLSQIFVAAQCCLIQGKCTSNDRDKAMLLYSLRKRRRARRSLAFPRQFAQVQEKLLFGATEITAGRLGREEDIMTKTFLVSAIVIMLAASGVAAEDMDHAAMAAQGDMAAPAQAITATLGSLKISGGYLKAMIPGQPVGGGFVTINNTGSVEDKLIAISSPRAMRVELHEMVMQGTIMKMRKIPDGFAIAPGATLKMEPGGYHLMFMGVQMPFKADQTVPVTLTFEKAGKLELAMPVVTVRGR
ncbi:copper chaperone PCu(A)C [Agrobacterium vitis]|uniref:Copper chaperone PCu(A)C n=2 Tax=Agrobacterium vitis TaxID=373 RepID=A0A6I4GAL6_AGRVI|nr:copper chaperone PCu(A)C [Agrobacterium vitis]MVA82578.1 copper chaperone PCu(A)C [Agrobacterium vitis]